LFPIILPHKAQIRLLPKLFYPGLYCYSHATANNSY